MGGGWVDKTKIILNSTQFKFKLKLKLKIELCLANKTLLNPAWLLFILAFSIPRVAFDTT